MSEPSMPAPPRKSHKSRNIAILAIVIVVIVAGAYVALVSNGFVVVKKTTITTVAYSTTEVVQSPASNVVNGMITVSAGNYEYYQVTVPSDVSGAVLFGSFTASGGSGNDIIVLIMDQTDFVNWQNGHQASTYYNSGQVTTDSFSVPLSAGETYYLVYSNTFSTFSSKDVSTQATLEYTQNVQTVITYTTTYVST